MDAALLDELDELELFDEEELLEELDELLIAELLEEERELLDELDDELASDEFCDAELIEDSRLD